MNLFENEQFAVTQTSLQLKIPTLGLDPIPVSSLTTTVVFRKKTYYRFPLELSLHPLVNLQSLEQAYRMALHLFRDSLPDQVNTEQLDRSFRAAAVMKRSESSHRKAPKSLRQGLSWAVRAERDRRKEPDWSISYRA